MNPTQVPVIAADLCFGQTISVERWPDKYGEANFFIIFGGIEIHCNYPT